MILKQQIQQLGAVIGMGLIQMIKPVVATINNALSGIIEFSKKVVNALGKIFGWQLEMSTSGMSLDDSDIDTSGLEDVVDNADGASDSLDKATKSAKKFKDQLQGFDKLNVLRTTQTDSDSPSSSNGGKGSGDTGKGTGVGTVNQGDVKSALKKTKSMFESDIDDLYGLGKYIGETLRKALAGIDWNRVYQGARNFGKGLAEFLNGLISPELFSAIGKTIAGCLNTAFHFLDSFGQTFDWSNFGKSIGVGLTTFLNTLDWNTALSAAYNWGRGVALALNNFLASTSFDAIGRTIAKSINLAVTNALAFGKTFNFSLLGIKLASAVNSALSNINWSDIASAVHEWATGLARTINAFLWKTDFTQIGSTLAHVLGEAIRFAFDFGNTINFAELGQKLADAVNGFIATFPAGKFADTIDVWVQGLYDLVVEFFKNLDWNGLKDKIKEFFGRLDWKTIEILLSGLAIVKAGGFAITIGSAIISAIATQFTKQIATVIIAKMASSPLLAGAIGKGLGEAAKSGANGSYLGTAGASLGKSLFGTFMVGGGTYIAVQSFLEMWKNGWHIAGELFKDFGIAVAMGGAVVLGVLSGPFAIAIGAGIAAVSTLAIVVHDNWDKIAGTIKQKVEETGENLEKMKSDAGRVGSDLKEAWNGLVTDASTAWGELSKGAGETFETVRGTISEKWGAIKKWWTTNSTLEKIKTTVENFRDKVKTKWGETISFWNGKNPLNEVKTTYENIKGKIAAKWNETQSYWRGKNPLAQVKTTYENFKEKVSTGWTQVQQFWNNKPTLKDVQVKVASIVEKVKSAWQTAKNWVASHFDLGKLKLGLKYPSIKVDVGWKNIAGVSIPVPSVSWSWKSFAKGGFLDQFNSFTMATLGEDGVPEILGQVGGRPAVAGGAEITGIRDSVESTGYEQISLLRRQNQILMQILNKEFGISKDEIFSAVKSKNNEYIHRTGRSAFAT